MSRARACQKVALDASNKVYTDLIAAGVSKGDAAESASRIYDAEYRAELTESYGEDFREPWHDLEPDELTEDDSA